MESLPWAEKALCRNKAQDLWYPPMDSTTPEKYHVIAKKVCSVCPVWDYCLDLGKKEMYGVWGGLAPQERLQMQRNKGLAQLAPHGTMERSRQGCDCDACNDFAPNLDNKINISVIPHDNKDLADLEELLILVCGV